MAFLFSQNILLFNPFFAMFPLVQIKHNIKKKTLASQQQREHQRWKVLIENFHLSHL